ncbi:MAG: DUF6470 family protein [Bacillota bacterium]
MGLEIRSVPTKLHVETTRPQLTIESRRARLEFSREDVKIDIHTEMPRVIIDSDECFDTMGLMDPIDLTRKAAQQGMQQALAYIGKVAEDGDSIAALENPVDPMPDIALRDAYPEHEFVLDFIPKARPKATVTGGVRISSSGGAQGRVMGVYTPGGVSIRYTPAKVKISVAQYASISMKYVHRGFSDGFSAYI